MPNRSAEVSDPLGQADVAWLTVQVDGRPSAPAASLTPALPGTEEAVVAAVLTPAVDPEGAPLTYQVDWLRDGLPQVPWSGIWTLPASATSRGQTWTVLLSADDGLNLSAPGTASATVVNTAPSTAPPAVSPSPLGSLDEVLCLPGASVDPDGDAVSHTVGWTLNGVDTGLTGPTLAAESTELGDLVRCWVEPHDGFVSGEAVLSSPEPVVDLPPSIPGLALSPSLPRTTHDLVGSLVSPSVDPEGEPVSYLWTWSMNGVPQPAWDGMSWLPATATARDELWRVEVVASDGSVESAPGSASMIIQNSPPGPPGLAIVPDDSPTDLDLHCDLVVASVDVDGDPVHYAYSWSLTVGPPLSTGSTLPASMTVSGEVWTCSAIPFDGTDTGPSAQATTLVGPPSQFVGFDGTFGTSWQSLPAPIEPSYALDVYHPLEMDWIHNNHGSPPERFDGLAQQWVDAPPTPCGPPWATLAPWDGRLWLARCDAIHAYDPVSELWTVEAGLVGGDDLNMTETDEAGHVYGYTEAGSIVDYDSVAGSVSYLVTGLGRQYETRLAYDPAGHALFLGAYNGSALHRVDLATGSTTALTPIPETQLGDIFCGDRAGHIYVAGGTGGSSMWQYDIASDAWNPLPDLPADHGDNGSCTVSETGWLYVGTGSLGTLFRLPLY